LILIFFVNLFRNLKGKEAHHPEHNWALRVHDEIQKLTVEPYQTRWQKFFSSEFMVENLSGYEILVFTARFEHLELAKKVFGTKLKLSEAPSLELSAEISKTLSQAREPQGRMIQAGDKTPKIMGASDGSTDLLVLAYHEGGMFYFVYRLHALCGHIYRVKPGHVVKSRGAKTVEKWQESEKFV